MYYLVYNMNSKTNKQNLKKMVDRAEKMRLARQEKGNRSLFYPIARCTPEELDMFNAVKSDLGVTGSAADVYSALLEFYLREKLKRDRKKHSPQDGEK